jgi:hypothetical protein
MLGFRYKQRRWASGFGYPRNSKEPQLHFKFFGHEFTKEDKDNLKMEIWGGVVDLTNKTRNNSINYKHDKLTNRLIAYVQPSLKFQTKSIKLDDQQKHTLSEGKPCI